jgi:hypothetical protein
MVTLETVLAETQKNNRVCPQPQQWQALYEMLPEKKRKGAGWEPSLPLILAAWWDTPALPKCCAFVSTLSGRLLMVALPRFRHSYQGFRRSNGIMSESKGKPNKLLHATTLRNAAA